MDLNNSQEQMYVSMLCLELKKKAIIVNSKGHLDIHMVDIVAAFRTDASWGDKVEGGN